MGTSLDDAAFGHDAIGHQPLAARRLDSREVDDQPVPFGDRVTRREGHRTPVHDDARIGRITDRLLEREGHDGRHVDQLRMIGGIDGHVPVGGRGRRGTEQQDHRRERQDQQTAIRRGHDDSREQK